MNVDACSIVTVLHPPRLWRLNFRARNPSNCSTCRGIQRQWSHAPVLATTTELLRMLKRVVAVSPCIAEPRTCTSSSCSCTSSTFLMVTLVASNSHSTYTVTHQWMLLMSWRTTLQSSTSLTKMWQPSVEWSQRKYSKHCNVGGLMEEVLTDS